MRSEEKTPITRRNWLKRVVAATATASAGLGAYVWRIEPHWVEIVARDMPIAGLPASLEGKRVVQLSDIHIGENVDDDFLMSWFRQVATWEPDFVVFTGDFLTLRRDGSLPIEQMNQVLRQFPQGKLGTIGILGNHDFGAGWNDPGVAGIVVSIAEKAGIEILRNESREVAGLQFVGFDDYLSPCFGGAKVLKDVDLDRPTITLCHNPDAIDSPIWGDYRGWILSGHTHGGQCKPPFLTPPVLPIYNKRYASGFVALEDGRRLYVNRALGHSLPVRFNVRPEITVFRLVRDDDRRVTA